LCVKTPQVQILSMAAFSKCGIRVGQLLFLGAQPSPALQHTPVWQWDYEVYYVVGFSASPGSLKACSKCLLLGLLGAPAEEHSALVQPRGEKGVDKLLWIHPGSDQTMGVFNFGDWWSNKQFIELCMNYYYAIDCILCMAVKFSVRVGSNFGPVPKVSPLGITFEIPGHGKNKRNFLLGCYAGWYLQKVPRCPLERGFIVSSCRQQGVSNTTVSE